MGLVITAMIMESDGKSNKESLVRFLSCTNHLTHAQSVEVSETFQYKHINKNDYLLEEGRVANEYYFLQEGFLRSYVYDVLGNDITTHFYKPQQPVFEVSSFFTRSKSKENIQAITSCSGWYISFDQLNSLFHSHPQFREFGRTILVKGFADLKGRMLLMLTETAEKRYQELLTSNHELLKYASLKHIATYLGITDTSLSRIRKEYSRK